MPRAVDPGLYGQQLTIDHSPLNRIGTQVRKPDFDIGDLLEGAKKFIEDFLFPAIEALTGIDLSMFLPLLDLLDLDFSSPIAFFHSLINAVLLLPEIVLALIQSLIDSLINLPETFAELISGFIMLLVELPEILYQLLLSIIEMIANLFGVDLSQFLPLWMDLDFSNPIAFFTSVAQALLDSTFLLLGMDSPLNSLNLFNLIPTDIMALIPMSNIGEALTNLITDGDFLDVLSLSNIPGWIHDLTGGFGGTGAMFTDATGIVKELFGNLIPVSEGQIVPISGMAKWTGLVGSGNPIQLALTGYKGGVAMIQQVIASHGVVPPTTDWLTLSGEFAVPAGIDAIRTRLTVGSGATAGQVGFSKLSATKIGAMLQRLIRGTNVGEFLPNDIEHLFTGIVSNTMEILDRALAGDLQGVIDAIAGDIGSTITDIEQKIGTFLDAFSPLNGDNIFGEILDEFVPGIGSINDNIVNNLGNIAGSGFSHLQVGQALRTQATAITTMSAQLSQITNRLLTLGVDIIDDFARLSTTGLGANWITNLLNSNGRIATPNGFAAEWIPGAGNITNQFISIFNGSIAKTQTNIQNVIAVLSGQAQQLVKGSNVLTGFNDVWTRVSNTTTSLANVTGTRGRFGANGSVRIDNFINGVLTTPIAAMPAGSITAPGAGAILGIVAGFMGDLQTFGAMIGNTAVLIGNAPSSTPVGPTYLGSGIGGQASGAAGAPGYPVSTAAPAPIYQFNAMDGGKAGAPGAPG